IFAVLIFLIIILIGLNAASYVQKDKTPDSEFSPNRSTYNTGATGTRAFYELLAETGREATRWQEPPSALLADNKNKPQTFVIIGKTRREFEPVETEQILQWVSEGGKLVVIDREPPPELIQTTANWSVFTDAENAPAFFDLDPSDQKQMTDKTVAAKPVQPTIFTSKVNAVQSSRFASSIKFEHFEDGDVSTDKGEVSSSPKTTVQEDEDYYDEEAPPNPMHSRRGTEHGGFGSNKNPPPISMQKAEEMIETPTLNAPVTHLANDKKTLLADFPYGAGQIVFLTDPYIISNGGINLVDNAQLAINVVASNKGIVAFDEFHQGYGAGENRLLGYFAGTPLVAIFLQFAAFVGFILFTQSRRFARPLPELEPNRLSKLEYVSAMAELQQRTRAYDLAIENIYTDFRRRVARLVGADNFTASYKDLARLVAERSKLNHAEIENLMFKCEDIIRGEPTNKREVLELTSRLREVEEILGLKRNQPSFNPKRR
ncbi:MAG: DUF4350 domain-containing protein, partial [Acidobacteriota bacterium]|nr:DUF4350 domain-containing protein [Acidobacteriota bacterium]